MVELFQLDDETVQKAFWLQEHIRQEGIDAIRYMHLAREEAKRTAADTVADHIERELKT